MMVHNYSFAFIYDFNLRTKQNSIYRLMP